MRLVARRRHSPPTREGSSEKYEKAGCWVYLALCCWMVNSSGLWFHFSWGSAGMCGVALWINPHPGLSALPPPPIVNPTHNVFNCCFQKKKIPLFLSTLTPLSYYWSKNKWISGAVVTNALSAPPMKPSKLWDNSVFPVKVLPDLPLSLGLIGHGLVSCDMKLIRRFAEGAAAHARKTRPCCSPLTQPAGLQNLLAPLRKAPCLSLN